MKDKKIYFDYNASAPLRPQSSKIYTAISTNTGNASSAHSYGRHLRGLVEEARDNLSSLLGVLRKDIIFTSGATEANNMVLRGFSYNGVNKVIPVISAAEHASIYEAADSNKLVIGVDDQGRIDIVSLENILSRLSGVVLLSVILANNETGVINDIGAISEVARARKSKDIEIILHCDAVQAVGRIDLSTVIDRVDLLTLSSHKLGGNKGAGALICADSEIGRKCSFNFIKGGGQERGLRAGTEDVASICSFVKALELSLSEMNVVNSRLEYFREYMEKKMLKIAPKLEIFSSRSARISNTSCFALQGYSSEFMVMSFDLEDIAISAGSACSSGRIEESRILRAMGYAKDIALSSFRVSMGAGNSFSEVEDFIDIFAKIVKK